AGEWSVQRHGSLICDGTRQEAGSIRQAVAIAELQYGFPYVVSHRAIETPIKKLSGSGSQWRVCQRRLARGRVEESQLRASSYLKCHPADNLSSERKLENVPVHRLVGIAKPKGSKTVELSDCVVARNVAIETCLNGR